MKTREWVGLIAALALPVLAGSAQMQGTPEQPQAAAPADLSPAAAEVVRLAGSGVGDDVVLAYINNSQAPFNLSADAVLYLKDLGLSPQVTSAMLSHDSTLRGQAPQYAPAAPAPAPPPAAAPAPVPPTAPPEAVAAPTPTYVSSPPPDVSYFYNDLAPYGTWVNLDGYGWCWQPQAVVISRGWRPYCDGGYWVYSDTGWYWQSTYSWGWAPFHYGRWHLHPRCGWVWFPDRVWGPAWVTWRVAGEGCGWAPLPPHADFDVRLGWRFNGVRVGANFDFGLGVGAFAFVSFGDFCSHDIHHHCLPPARVTTIYRQTTIVNNYEVRNNVIVHRGIPVERVAAASRVPVPRATVREWHATPDRMPTRGGAVVYRPQLYEPARPAHMVAQKVDDRHPVIVHTPAAPPRVEQPAAINRGGSAPNPAPRRTATEPSKGSPWSSGASHSAAPPSQSAPRLSQPAPNVRPAPSAPRPTQEWKQGTQSAPSYRSGPSSLTPASSEPRNNHVFQPKGYEQSGNMRSTAPPSPRQGESPSSPDRGSDSRSRKKD